MRKVVCSYSQKDEKFLVELKNHMTSLERAGRIKVWYDGKTLPGQEFKKEIDLKFESADVILLLISSDFMASDYCYLRELHLAMHRHNSGASIVIPVILRPCKWQQLPFGKLRTATKDDLPIALYKSRDEGYLEVVNAIEMAIDARSAIVQKTPRLSVHEYSKSPKILYSSDGSICEESLSLSSLEYLDVGRESAIDQLESVEERLPSHGFFEVSAKFDRNFLPVAPDPNFTDLIRNATPYVGENHSWAFFDDFEEMPYQINEFEDGFETYCYAHNDLGIIDSLRFNRFISTGMFYHLRTLGDDDNKSHGLQNRKPYSGFDIDLPVIDVIASAVITLRYAERMGLDSETGYLELSFRWSGLKGRNPTAWVRHSDRWMFKSSKKITKSTFVTTVEIRADTKPTELLQLIFPKLKPLYDLMQLKTKSDDFVQTTKLYVLDRL